MTNSTQSYVWWGPVAADSIPLNSLIDIGTIVTCDYGTDVQLMERDKNVFSLEKKLGVKKPWGDSSVKEILQEPLKQDIENFLRNTKKPTIIIPYSSSTSLENAVYRNNPAIKIASIPARLKRTLDDKILFRELLKEHDINFIPGEMVDLQREGYSKLAKRYGARFVVQTRFGAGGNNTFLIRGEEDFIRLKKQGGFMEVLVMPYLNGWSVNVHGVVTDKEVILAQPSIQLIGIKECTRYSFAWCGNDFGFVRNIDRTLIAMCQDYARVVGELIRLMGYKGIYGLDLLVDEDAHSVYPIEINPRFQGSTALLTQLEMINKIDPLVGYHLRAYGIDQLGIGGHEHSLITTGSQIVIHNRHPVSVFAVKQLNAGIYRVKADELGLVRSGDSLKDCHDEDEFVLNGGLPLLNQKIKSDAAFASIQTYKSVLQPPALNKLTPWAQKVANVLYRHILQ